MNQQIPSEMVTGGTRSGPGSGEPLRKDALPLRYRAAAILLVLFLIAAQTWLMGRAISLLSVGLAIACGVWLTLRWRNNPSAVLPVYLLAIVVQCLHFTEEYLSGFSHQFPPLMGGTDWSDARFVTFNTMWLAIFVLAAAGVYRRMSVAYLVVIFLGLIGGVANGASHLLLSVIYRGYFPGVVTAPLCLLVGTALLVRLFGGTKPDLTRNSR